MKNSIEKNKVLLLIDSVEYSPNAIVSKQVVKNNSGNITLFAFDEGEELSEHTSPYDAIIHLLEGNLLVKIGDSAYNLTTGNSIIMEEKIPHAVLAKTRVKFILTMLKGSQ